MRSKTSAVWIFLLALGLAVPASGQSRTDREKMAAQSELAMAEAALASAEAAGAATNARELYGEAADRLRLARTNWNNNDRKAREEAGRRAVEARHAAMAAEAQARLVGTNVEVRTLRTDINNNGGNAVMVDLYDPPALISRGTTSRDRVIVAETAVKNARAAGAERFAAKELEQLEGNLDTARMLVERNNRPSPNADHLAYIAEMTARRLEYQARLNQVTPHLTTFRAERTRLTQRVQDNRVAEEQQRRIEAEREAAELREQLVLTEAELGERLAENREARIAAEQRLDILIDRYETALSQRGVSSAEVEQLRREMEDQRVALRTIQERELLSESSMGNQIASLEQSLQRERNEGRLTADVLAQREDELRRQRAELDRLRQEREASERRRAEAESARAAALAEAERLRAAAQSQAAAAQSQAAAAQSQATQLRENLAQTSAALEETRTELARREAADRERITTMQQELAKLAETRNTERGFIVTLPGLFFDSGKSALKPGARNTLAKIADQLRAGHDAQISIEGHTDSVGSEEYNQALSEKRAAAVRDYLVSRGIAGAKINIAGQGETAPVASNDTPAGRQQNRRVELVIATPQQ